MPRRASAAAVAYRVERPSLRETLLAEQDLIAGMLGRAVEAARRGDAEGALAAWRPFAAAIVAQIGAEERLLVASLPGGHERAARVVPFEHRYLRACVAELGELLAHRGDSAAGLRGLLDVFRAHTRNDDTLLYHWAEQHLDEPVRSEVLDASEERQAVARAASSAATSSSTLTGFVR
jgi:hypothetical protein